MLHHNSIKLNSLPAKELLEECFSYNPENGLLTWRRRPLAHFMNEHRWNNWNAKWSGKIAGNSFLSEKRGRHPTQIGVSLNGKMTLYKAHHIIVKMMGVDVDGDKSVDHINGDPWDNRWTNLRLISHRQNCHNRGAYRRNGKKRLLPKGVWFDADANKYIASINCNGKQKKIGRFNTPVEASMAYEKRARELFGEFYRSPSLESE